MINFLNVLEEGPVKAWYKKHLMGFDLDGSASGFEQQGYTLDSKSGLLTRPHFDEGTTRLLGYTLIDLVLLRPTDFHYHPEMEEGIRVLGGRGLMILDPANNHGRTLKEGDLFFISQGTKHAFRPNKGGFLEIEVACTKIYTPDQEVCVTSFDNFPPWQQYFAE
jgi:mannose-6-phosphate isomerase-like protein (cupin superfamily)